MKAKSTLFIFLAIVVSLSAFMVGCDHAKMEPRSLVDGGKAFVRIKQYESTPAKDWTPKGAETKFAYGDTVTLITKKERDGNHNVYWLVSKTPSDAPAWIPDYVLTSSKAEIDSLRSKDRIPETMTFIYERDAGESTRLAGTAHILPFITYSDAIPASNQGSDQVAIKGNGVVFDPTAAKHLGDGPYPMIFSNGRKTWVINSNLMCFCTDVDNSRGSDCSPSSSLVTNCRGGGGDAPKGKFDCVEVAGDPVTSRHNP